MKFRKNIERLFICCFFMLICIPFFGVFMGADDKKFIKYESRKANPFPVRISFHEFEKWFGDRFLLRWQLTELWSTLNYSMGISSRPDQVVIGDDGWLFLGNKWDKSIDQYRGIAKPSSAEIQQKTIFFKQMRDYLTQKGIPFIVVMAPDKQTIYPEKLPRWVGDRSEETRLSLLQKELSKRDIDVIDLTQTELAAKNKLNTVYFPGDSHWNSAGGYYAYQTIIHEIGKRQLPVTYVEESDISYTHNVKSFRTDIANMLQLDYESYDVVPWSQKFSDKLTLIDKEGNKSWNANQAVFGFQIGNNPVVVRNESASNHTKVLLYRDSYGEAMCPYLHQSVYETVHLHYENGLNNQQAYAIGNMVEIYKPDIVVFQIVERALIRDLSSMFLRANRIENKAFSANTYINSFIDHVQNDTDSIIIDGWAYIPGVNTEDYSINIILKSNEITYTYDAQRVIREDVAKYYNVKNNVSGFKTQIFKDNILKGEYEIEIYLEGKDEVYGLKNMGTKVKI